MKVVVVRGPLLAGPAASNGLGVSNWGVIADQLGVFRVPAVKRGEREKQMRALTTSVEHALSL